MDTQILKKLVRQGEGVHVEFKLKSNHPEKIVREVVAFANTQGGTLLIGVSDQKQLIGLQFPDEDEYILRSAIEKYCYPSLIYHMERCSLNEDDEREILVINIPKSPFGPHYVLANHLTSENKMYVRVGDKSLQASKELRQILKQSQKQKNFRFHYGEKENLLMKYLAEHPRITLDTFAEIAQIPKKVASRTLVLLTLANVLQILPSESKDYFTIAPYAEN